MDYLIAIIFLLIGAGGGGFTAYFLLDRKFRENLSVLQTAHALAEQRVDDISTQLSAEKAQTLALRESLATGQRDLAAMRAQFEGARQNLLEQRKLLDDAQGRLSNVFASVSAEALAKNNEAFLQLAQEKFATISAEATGSLDERKAQIEGLLKPMREVIDQYQSRVGEIEKSRVESYSMLREQLGTLAETQRTLNTQTAQLVTALSRPSVRGQWGEISLRKLVELAGLSSKCDFVEQASVDTDEGRLRPDMIVKLPGGRDVIIDCKTCLDAFLEAAAATDEDARRVQLQRHAQQVRARARELAAKSYWSQFANSPEYVVMFLPGDAFLYAAAEHDTSLVEDCIKNSVIIATPTTLIALLKVIEFGWRQEAITENAEKIRELGTALYDRIATVLTHMNKIGSSLSATVNSYNSAVGSLETRVLVTARKMSELSGKADQEMVEPTPVDRLPREITSVLIGVSQPALFEEPIETENAA